MTTSYANIMEKGKRLKTLLAVSATALIASVALATPAFAAVNSPPVLPHSIISFPQRDFISADGYDPGQKATVNVIRNGVTIGTSTEITVGADHLVEVNHPGGGCWVGHTPDIMPGDVVQVLTAPGTGDATTTANVTAKKQTVEGGVLTVHGTAQTKDAAGNVVPLPLDQIQARLVNNTGFTTSKNRRTLRADSTGTLDGTLAYDPVDPATNPQGINWTATYPNAGPDQAVALSADTESRGIWLGANPAALNEQTIYEVGTAVAPGPATPDCTAPLAQYGVLNSDAPASGINQAFLNAGGNLTLSGVSQDASGVSVVLSDGAGHSLPPVTATPTPATGAQSWSVTIPRADVATLSDGTLTATGSYTVTDPVTGTPGTIGGQTLTIQKDVVPPGAPTALALDPASNSGAKTDNLTNDNTPTLTGNADAGSTVELFDGATKVGSGKADGGSYSITTSNSLADGDHAITAKATDPAGNVSAASSALNVTIDTKSPAVTADPGSTTLGPTQKVSLASEAGAKIYFTKDGTDPRLNADGTPNGTTTVYTGSLSFAANTTLKYIGVDAADNQSQVATQTYTIDAAKPTILTKSPSANATGVFVGANVKATFNEAVVGVSGATFKLKQGATTIPAAVTYSAASNTAMLNPNVNLAHGKKYTVVMTSGIKDRFGNALVATSWSFTTK